MIRLLTLLAACALVPAYGDQITIAGFVSPTVETYDGLDALFSSSCGGIPCASTPLVIHGNTYKTDDGTLRDLNFNPQNETCSGEAGACINTDDDLGFIDITFGTPMRRIGGSATTFGNVEFDFYSPGNSLLGSVSGGSGFVAWQDPGGIGRIRVTDIAQNRTSMVFDDLTFEGPVTSGTGGSSVPEPTSGILLGGSMLLAVFLGRRVKS
jgi:hypothetical protein